jgi:hypothetical protein
MKRAGARAQDDQHADQAERGGEPAAHAHLLTEEDNGERSDEQRCDEAGCGRFAIGRKRKPVMKNSEEPSSTAPRITCNPRRSVRIA